MKFWPRSPVKDNWYQNSINLHAKHRESSFVQMSSETKDLDVAFFFFFFNVSCTWVSIASSYLKCALRVLRNENDVNEMS